MKVKCYTKDADGDSEEDEQINLCLGFMSIKFVCLQGAASVALLSSSSTLVPHTGPAMKRRVSNRSRQRNSFISSLSSKIPFIPLCRRNRNSFFIKGIPRKDEEFL